MAKDLNVTILIGNIVARPDLSYTNTGTAICKFRLANNDQYTKDGQKVEVAHFFDVEAWGKTGEIIAQYCDKGSRVGINGNLKQQRWQGQDGVNHSRVVVGVETIQFLNKREEGDGGKDIPASQDSGAGGF